MTNKKLHLAIDARLTALVLPVLDPLVNAMATFPSLHQDLIAALTDVFSRLTRLEAVVLPPPKGGASGETQAVRDGEDCPLCGEPQRKEK